MANRYCVNTGNWNSTATWSATSGGASGASVPTSADEVVLNTNKTVTLTADAAAATINHTNGTLSLGSYALSVDANLDSGGSTARAINCGSGTILFTGVGVGQLTFSGSNLTFNCGTGSVQFNGAGTIGSVHRTIHFAGGSKTFNRVDIFLGYSSTSVVFNITGMYSVDILNIASTNSRPHTVTLGTIFTNRYCIEGASSSNKITLGDGTAAGAIYMTSYGSGWGNNVNINGVSYGGGDSTMHPYLGSTSTETYRPGAAFLFQDPPKANTLIDKFIGASIDTNKWITSTYKDGTVTQNNGLTVATSNASIDSFANFYSKDTYNLIDSAFSMKVANITMESDYNQVLLTMPGYYPKVYIDTDCHLKFTGAAGAYISDLGLVSPGNIISYTGGDEPLIKMTNSSGAVVGQLYESVSYRNAVLTYSARVGVWISSLAAASDISLTLEWVGVTDNSSGNFLTFFNGA